MKTIPIMLPNNVPVTCKTEHGFVKIAATNIVFKKFKDERGAEQSGWTAALSLMVGEERQTMKAYKVTVGQRLQYDRFALRVLGIDNVQGGMAVLVEVGAADGSFTGEAG
jgi:hypothetical protein